MGRTVYSWGYRRRAGGYLGLVFAGHELIVLVVLVPGAFRWRGFPRTIVATNDDQRTIGATGDTEFCCPRISEIGTD